MCRVCERCGGDDAVRGIPRSITDVEIGRDYTVTIVSNGVSVTGTSDARRCLVVRYISIAGRYRSGVAMHFGLYLKKKGVITAEQFVAALELQLATLPRIGQLALEEGLISPRQVFDVLQVQRKLPEMRFGNLAIEMGLMTRNDLTRLLMIQADRKRPLAEVLVMEGMLNGKIVARELDAFQQLQSNRRAVKADYFKVVPAPRSDLAVQVGDMSVAN